MMLFAVGTSLPSFVNPMVAGVFMSGAFGMFLFVLLRFGILASVLWGIYMWLASSVVLTLDSSAWYAGRSWFTLLVFAALAAYGFWISLAGWPLMRGSVLEGK